MKVNPTEFCSLSTSESFLTWLYRSATDLHESLIDHLRQGKGCSENRNKMMKLLEKIRKDRDLELSFAQFLREYYPHLISEDSNESTNHQLVNKHGVFTFYDPTLNSYPRRIIIQRRAESDLDRDVLGFCAQQGYCEHIIVDDRAYVEYLPRESMKFKDKIPDRNWEIRTYKRANSLK